MFGLVPGLNDSQLGGNVDYKLISCDDHLDLNQLPADLWTARVAKKDQERAPHIEERDGRAVWISDGKVWGGWSGKPRPAGVAKPAMPVVTALDRGGDLQVGLAIAADAGQAI